MQGRFAFTLKHHDDKDNLIDHMGSTAATSECFFVPKPAAKLASAMGLLLWPASYIDKSRPDMPESWLVRRSLFLGAKAVPAQSYSAQLTRASARHICMRQ